jgi:hypothetical protein
MADWREMPRRRVLDYYRKGSARETIAGTLGTTRGYARSRGNR